jgi:translation initiation factor 2B subunit (eIF-2B alpha/beta/delta family)
MWLECAYRIKHSAGIQRVKNDKADSKAIAEYAMRNYDKMILYKPQSSSLTCLREVFLYRHSLVRQKVSLQVRRDEKRLTQERSDARAFMSFTSKHLITEVNKAIAKCDQKIKDIGADNVTDGETVVTLKCGMDADGCFRHAGTECNDCQTDDDGGDLE